MELPRALPVGLHQKLGYGISKTGKANDRLDIVYLEKKIESSF